MSWHGIGLIAGSSTPLPAMSALYMPPSVLQPAAQWNGLAGSGFTAVPSDPVRTVAKPALRLLTPANQYFTDTLDVGVMAMANEGGSLTGNFGIRRVDFHYEGSVVSVVQPTFHTIPTPRGPKTYFGWWVRLKKPASTSGNARLYVEATARDATMQKRVIGPYLFSPVAQQYTHSLTIAPSLSQITGQRYQTLNAAVTWLNAQAAPANPLITITEAGLFELTVGTGADLLPSNQLTQPGRLNITASVPGVVLGRATYSTDAAAKIDNGRFKLRLFGANLTVDFRRVIAITGPSTDDETGGGNWLDGVTLTSTAPYGSSEPWRGTHIPAVNGLALGGASMTEVVADQVTNVAIGAQLVRGGTFDNIAYDAFNGAKCVIGTAMGRLSSSPIGDEIPAFTIHYTGAEATATLSRTPQTQNAVWTVRIGASTYTFDSGPSNPASPQSMDYFNGVLGDGYWTSDLVEWLNTLPNITAVLQLDESDSFEKRAAAGASLTGLQGGGFTDRDIKTAPLQVVTSVPYHPDWYQHGGGFLENVIVAFNTCRDMDAQAIFLSPFRAGADIPYERDVFFVANALGVSKIAKPGAALSYAEGAFSQFGRSTGMIASHVVIAHNSVGQGFWVRTSGIADGSTADSYCLIKNNVFRNFIYDAAGPMPNLMIDGLRIFSGFPAPLGASKVLVGGTDINLFVDYANGNLRPAGALAQAGLAPAVMHDIDQAPFPEYVPPPPSATPLNDLIAAVNAAGGQSSIHRLRTANVTGGIWRSEDISANNNDLVQATGSAQPTIGALGATFTSNHVVAQTITGGTFTIVVSFTKIDASIGGSMVSNQAAGKQVQYVRDATTLGTGAVTMIDGNTITSRAAFYNALHQTGRKVVVMQNCNFVGDTQLRLGRGGNSSLAGLVDWFIVINEASFPENLSQIRSWAQQVASST